MGHEYVGVVEEIGAEVRTVKVGDFVVGSFLGLRQHLRDLPGRLPGPLRAPASSMGTIGTQSELARIPLADGTLVATPACPTPS